MSWTISYEEDPPDQLIQVHMCRIWEGIWSNYNAFAYPREAHAVVIGAW